MQRLAYSIREVAALTGLSARTITRQIRCRALRAVRVSRRVVIPADARRSFSAVEVTLKRSKRASRHEQHQPKCHDD
jgi:excisionase family DNA binding protein